MNKKEEGTEKANEEDEEGMTDKETEEGSEQNSNEDQDSDVYFQQEADEEIDATDKEEDWIEYTKRSTKEAEEHMEKHKNKMLDRSAQKTKMAYGKESHYTTRTEEYSTGILDWTLASIRARRQVGRPKRRWEDDLNEFMKQKKDKIRTNMI